MDPLYVDGCDVCLDPETARNVRANLGCRDGRLWLLPPGEVRALGPGRVLDGRGCLALPAPRGAAGEAEELVRAGRNAASAIAAVTTDRGARLGDGGPADVWLVPGGPLADIRVLRRPRFVLEGGILRTAAQGCGGRLRTPGAHLRLEGPWDWTGAAAIVWEARAATAARIRVAVEHGGGRWVFFFVPKPGLRLRVAVPTGDLRIRPRNTSGPGYFTFGGGPDPVDLGAVSALEFGYDQEGPPPDLEIDGVAASAEAVAPAVRDARPVVDGWGQWTGPGGAPRGPGEIRALWAAEEAAPEAGPSGRSRWGGDARHRLEATGRFRVDRLGGTWCLVDPDGHPFFSVGPDVLAPGAPGPVAGREALFAELTEALAAGRGGQADFHAAALRRRYGADPVPGWSRRAALRLRHWGFNTVGNWSAPAACALDLPWVTGLRGLDPWCHAVPDVFDPAFAAAAALAVRAQVAEHASDPSLIGYFVGNEPAWTFSGAVPPLASVWDGAHPHTVRAALDWLRQRHGGDLQALGRAWGQAYGSWDELGRAGPPDPRAGPEGLRRDAEAFAGWVLERFYGICCAAVRALDPGRLLLGSRFHSPEMPGPIVAACSAFDVVSFNCYRHEIPRAATARLLAVSGRPALCGEFHFGTCARGSSGGLVLAPDDAGRGEAYAAYVRAAAADPALLGAHWFQWVDEPVMGRFDGEDYNIGLVDVSDVPYAGLVAGARRAHEALYRMRFG